jgi:hypothetical protein
MEDASSLFDPGEANVDPGSEGDVANLDPSYGTGTIANLLPALPADYTPTSSMDDSSLTDFIQAEEDGDVSSTGTSSNFGSSFNLGSIGTTLASALGTGANSLLSAFVTNPANAQTAEAQALENAGIQQAQSSNLFSYLIIGLVIFLVFGFIERK